MSRIAIREAQPDDLPRLLELWEELMAFHEALDARFKRRKSSARAVSDFILHNIGCDEALVIVASIDGELTGYCMAVEAQLPPIFEIGPIGEIYDIVVAAKHRKQGLGSRMAEAAVSWARERGLTRIDLRTAIANPLACGFWRSVGAEPFLETMTIAL